jgi:hypothetical protein
MKMEEERGWSFHEWTKQGAWISMSGWMRMMEYGV